MPFSEYILVIKQGTTIIVSSKNYKLIVNLVDKYLINRIFVWSQSISHGIPINYKGESNNFTEEEGGCLCPK
jgi:hypothetical protein